MNARASRRQAAHEREWQEEKYEGLIGKYHQGTLLAREIILRVALSRGQRRAASGISRANQAAMAHKQALIFAARAIKDAETIPADYQDDRHWTPDEGE